MPDNSTSTSNHRPQTAVESGIRLLIIRFSSFGDIVQSAAVPAAFQSRYPGAQVDWLVREDLKGLLQVNPHIDQLISFPRGKGLIGLIRLAWKLASCGRYTHVYDAHNNVRSSIVVLFFHLQRLLRFNQERRPQIRIRPKNRIRRFLFFRLRWRSALEMPFRAIKSFHEPLQDWGLTPEPLSGPQFFVSPVARTEFTSQMAKEHAKQHIENNAKNQSETKSERQAPFDVALVPSAAWSLKRWPVAYWKKLIELMPDVRFVVLGGPDDQFCGEIAAIAPDRVTNLAGRLSLQGSAAALENSHVVVTGDTGLLQVADQLGRPTIALIGPSAFGYPTRPTSQVLEIQLTCKPCSKDGSGRCTNKVLQKCLVEISPERVAAAVREKLGTNQPTGQATEKAVELTTRRTTELNNRSAKSGD